MINNNKSNNTCSVRKKKNLVSLKIIIWKIHHVYWFAKKYSLVKLNIIGISTCSNKKNNHARLEIIFWKIHHVCWFLKKSLSLTDSF